MFRKASRKNLIAVALLLFLGFITTNLVNYYVSINSLREEIAHNELPLTGGTIYSEIKRDLMRPILIATDMANDTFLRDWALNGEAKVSQITKYLREVQTTNDTVTAFFVSDKTGIYYHSTGILKEISPSSDRDSWYYRLKDHCEPYEINVDVDLANNDAITVFINHKVRDYDGNFIGITGVGFTISSMTDLIEKYRGIYEKDIYFTDHNGNITVGVGSIERGESIFSRKGLKEYTKDFIMTSGDKPNYMRFKHAGDYVHLDSRYIPEFKWYLFVEQNEEAIIDSIKDTLAINSIIGAIITIIVSLMVGFVIRNYERRLERMASRDDLTGLYNRYAFNASFCRIHSEKEDLSKNVYLAMIDIDHFKRINDQYGHLTGDNVLRHVSNTIRRELYPEEFMGRWGGEEFVILLKCTSQEEAVERCNIIREKVANTPYRGKAKAIYSTISVGITICPDDKTCESTITKADKALYRAKKKGRNRTEFE